MLQLPYLRNLLHMNPSHNKALGTGLEIYGVSKCQELGNS